jgi:hypothetical protein
MRKILIHNEDACFWDNIDCFFGYGHTKEIIISKNIEIPVYRLKKYYPFLLKKEAGKIIKELESGDNTERAELVFSDAVSEKTKALFAGFKAANEPRACFMVNLPQIIRKCSLMFPEKEPEAVIIAENRDGGCFGVLDAARKYIKSFSLITGSEAFFDEVSEYAWKKYGLTANLKTYSDAPRKELAVILNKNPDAHNDFSGIAEYTIDISQSHKVRGTNYLVDFSSVNDGKLVNYPVKYYRFVEKEDKILNLKREIYKNELTN